MRFSRFQGNGYVLQAFPCVSTAIYGFPNEKAAQIALSAVGQWLDRGDNHAKVLLAERGIY